MFRKLKLIGLLILIVALVTLGIFLCDGSPGRSSKTIQVLPDGSLLRLADVQYTNGPVVYRATPVTGWRAKLAEKLPPAWSMRLGWSRMGGSVMFGGGGLGTNLTVFTFCLQATNTSFSHARAVFFDELGGSFDAGGPHAVLSIGGPGSGNARVDGWAPTAFPRRSKTLGVRFFEGSNSGPVAQFSFANPAQGDYPNWTAELLPATKTDGDLSVTFNDFKSGLSLADPAKPASSNEFAVTRATFLITQNGQPTKSWEPTQVEVSDATGNHWITFPYQKLSPEEMDSKLKSLAFEGALWPGESAWKLRFSFAKVTDFDAADLCTITGVPVPGEAETLTLTNSAKVGDVELKLAAIIGKGGKRSGNFRWMATKELHDNLALYAEHLPYNARVSVVKITDEKGNEIAGDGGGWNTHDQLFNFPPPHGARELNFTFAVHRSHIIEFLAKPEFVQRN